ncbi:hypothetical protein [Rhizobacter sp. Root404]|uniref:hypothetical protein n=1 Tax=Rhizobacter sp. Root404 TaxID=1736528 RepID=UPI0006FA1FA6|nr:hypothetical protein [Rhizobacter sp. Root404]KQW35696.1 hypothetical protein ASC76_22160 [Rhizobacter sp. Root404]
MEKIAVFVNDVASARHILQPMLEGEGPTHWVLVACPPTLTRHIGRWVSHSARRQWRERWATDLFTALQPELQARAGSEVETLIANRPLVDVSARLVARLPHLRLLDARQPRVGRTDEPISVAQPGQPGPRWAAPVAATAGLSVMLALAD